MGISDVARNNFSRYAQYAAITALVVGGVGGVYSIYSFYNILDDGSVEAAEKIVYDYRISSFLSKSNVKKYIDYKAAQEFLKGFKE